jgi:hypothetical protein
MNSACMIELKKEYTLLLCQVLSPIILEGLQHLYNESKKNSNKNNILKTFQLLLKAIPSWDNDIIRKEIERINFKTKEYPWIVQLIQSIFKMNILVNGLEPSEVMKKDVDMSLFIHTIYIECARQFWMDPFLFYHEYSSLEQKKNYCEIIKIICCCIENAIRRLLPLAAIFEKFLGEQEMRLVNGKSLDLFEQYNMPLILDMPMELETQPEPVRELVPEIHNEIHNNNIPQMENMYGGSGVFGVSGVSINIPNNNLNNSGIINGNNGVAPSIGFNNMESKENINEKILNIINKNNVLSDSNDNNNHFTVNNHSAHDNQMIPQMMQQQMRNQMVPQMIPQMMPQMMPQMVPQMQGAMMIPAMQQMIPQMMQTKAPQQAGPGVQNNRHHSDRRSSSTLKRIVHESIKHSQNTATKSNASNNSDIKNKILKDLDSDTLTYNPEDNAENYQDIFSNSDMKHTVNTNEKIEKKSREKFFNNYLNI